MPTNAERLRKAVEQRQQPRRMQSSATILGGGRPERMSIASSTSSSDSECLRDLSSHILPYLTHAHRASMITTATASSSASSSSASTLSQSHSSHTSPTIASSSNSHSAGRASRRLFEKAEHRLEDPQLVVAYSYEACANDRAADDADEKENEEEETTTAAEDPSTPIPTDIGVFSTHAATESFLPVSLRALDLDLDSSLHDALLTTFETTDLKPPPRPQPPIQIRPCGDPLGPLPDNHLARAGSRKTFGSRFKKLARSLAN